LGPLFTGTYNHGIDEKGRIIVPAKLRAAVQEERDGSGFWMSRGLDGCISMYTPRGWEQLRQRVPGTEFSGKRRNFERMLYAGAQYGMCDRQGRIIIPELLKEAAGIQKDVVIVGVGERIEIWGKERWDDLSAQTMESFEQDAEALFSLQMESEKKP